ncbi:MAG: AEC family transporter, partial [Spirochaetota bacterium]
MEATGRLTTLLLAVYGSLLLGFLSRRMLERPARASGVLSRLFLLVTSPLVILNSLWSVRITDLHTAALPLIQVFLQFLSLIPALLAARALNADRGEKGAVISCSMFSNTGPTLGMVICYALFGDRGMYLGGWFIVLFSPVYYLVAFPLLSLFSPPDPLGRDLEVRSTEAPGQRGARLAG